MNDLETKTAILAMLGAWVLMSLVVALLLGQVIRVADRLERRAEALEQAVRETPRMTQKPTVHRGGWVTAPVKPVEPAGVGIALDEPAGPSKPVVVRAEEPAKSGRGRRAAR